MKMPILCSKYGKSNVFFTRMDPNCVSVYIMDLLKIMDHTKWISAFYICVYVQLRATFSTVTFFLILSVIPIFLSNFYAITGYKGAVYSAYHPYSVCLFFFLKRRPPSSFHWLSV